MKKKLFVILTCVVVLCSLVLSVSAYIYYPKGIFEYNVDNLQGEMKTWAEKYNLGLPEFYDDVTIDESDYYWVYIQKGKTVRIGYALNLDSDEYYNINWELNDNILVQFTNIDYMSTGYLMSFCCCDPDKPLYDLGTPDLDFDFGYSTLSYNSSNNNSYVDIGLSTCATTAGFKEAPSFLWCANYKGGGAVNTYIQYAVTDSNCRPFINGNGGYGITVLTDDVSNATSFLAMFEVTFDNTPTHSQISSVSNQLQKYVDTFEVRKSANVTASGGGDFGGSGAGAGTDASGDWVVKDNTYSISVKWLADCVSGFMNTEIIGNISLGDITWFVIGLSTLFAVFKFFT